MKKVISIFLLCCFALYHFGYYVAYFSFRFQIESDWMEKIYSDNQEGLEEKLMEIPLSVPYMADEEDFRPTNTSFEKDGKTFRAIKQRYVNDTLQIVYVPDTAKRILDNTIKQWVSSLVQDDLPDAGNNSLLVKLFIKDYTPVSNDFDYSPVASELEQDFIGFIFSSYENNYFHLNSPPPELA
ncbi:hypothetical protein [Aquiflexum gelatinilyticum]|uniref:Uncharacterized protein n=1 Tax=Aquiflexum gelatinilyticum TaxID=2961943 RepID=A0A9X2P6D0_9BACT|nr:hypothetical protein [Aquiflexum gelatinilyticum]MCR9015133.1 hypothetical protein [Aquiflexum gelatinilyticum]MCS4433930.1 hypothetical protein [Aquiflexum gelatinilyticum]